MSEGIENGVHESVGTFKVVCMGDGAVGKTCLLSTFALGNFPTNYIPTIMDNFKKDIKIGDDYVDLVIWDTAGQEDFDRIRRMSYMETDCFIICFSVVEKVSLANVNEWYKDLLDNLVDHDNIVIILVGTKCDLKNDKQYAQRLCTQEDIDRKMEEIEAFDYVETSALKNINNNLVFERIARKLLARKKLKKMKKKNPKKKQKKKKKPKKGKKQKKKKKGGIFGLLSISQTELEEELSYLDSIRGPKTPGGDGDDDDDDDGKEGDNNNNNNNQEGGKEKEQKEEESGKEQEKEQEKEKGKEESGKEKEQEDRGEWECI